MKTPSTSTNGLKLFAGLGAAALLLAPLIAGVVAFRYAGPPLEDAQDASSAPEPEMRPLGAKGSSCGGSLSLPCSPGFVCKKMGNDPKAEGICEEAPPTRVEKFAGIGEACAEAAGLLCMPTLYCHDAKGEKTCGTKIKEAPHILSARFDGLQPTDDGFAADQKTAVSIAVEAVNADKAYILLIADGSEKSQRTEMTRTDGVFNASLKLKTGFTGRLVVIIQAKDGSTNSLLKRIALVE